MAEFITQDINLLLSSRKEATYNEVIADGGEFVRAVMRGNTFGFPVLSKTDSSDLVGTGYDLPVVPLRVNYWEHPVITIGEDVNVDLLPIFLARVFGGTNAAPSTLNTTGREHTILLGTAAQRQLPSSNLITSVGYIDDANPGADFQWTGVVGESIQIGQNRAETPTWSAELVGSGNYVHPVPALVRADFPALVGDDTANNDKLYIHGAAVAVTYNDGSVINLATEGRLKSWNFQLNNNLRRDDRRPGDPFRVANDPTSGAYVNRLQRGRRTCAAQVVVALNEDLAEFITMQQNSVVTNLGFIMKGQLITGATPATNYTLEINIPKAQLRTVTPGNENDDATLTLDWFPLKGTGEYVSARVINTRATAYA